MVTFNCDQTCERLSARLDHLAEDGRGAAAMAADELAGVESHLAECAACRAVAEALAETRAWCLEAGAVSAPAGFAAAVGAAIRSTPQEARPPRRLRGPGPIFATLGLAAGIMALAVLVEGVRRTSEGFIPVGGEAPAAEKRLPAGAETEERLAVAKGLRQHSEGVLQDAEAADKAESDAGDSKAEGTKAEGGNVDLLEMERDRQARKTRQGPETAGRRDLDPTSKDDRGDGPPGASAGEQAKKGFAGRRGQHQGGEAPGASGGGWGGAPGDGAPSESKGTPAAPAPPAPAPPAADAPAEPAAGLRERAFDDQLARTRDKQADDGAPAMGGRVYRSPGAAAPAARKPAGGAEAESNTDRADGKPVDGQPAKARSALRGLEELEKHAEQRAGAPADDEPVIVLVARVAPDSAEGRRLLSYLGTHGLPSTTTVQDRLRRRANEAADDAREAAAADADAGAPTEDAEQPEQGNAERARAELQRAGDDHGRGSGVDVRLTAAVWERLRLGGLETLGLADRVDVRPAGAPAGYAPSRPAPPSAPAPTPQTPARGGAPRPDGAPAAPSSRPSATPVTPTGPSGGPSGAPSTGPGGPSNAAPAPAPGTPAAPALGAGRAAPPAPRTVRVILVFEPPATAPATGTPKGK